MKDTFQIRFKKTLDNSGISQSELSRITGIRASSISDYYNGRYIPKQDKTTLIARALNVSPSWLLCVVDNDKLDIKEFGVLKENYYSLSTEGRHTLVDFSDALVKEENNKVKEDTELYSVQVTESVAAGLGYRYGNNETTTYYTDRDDLKEYDYATLVSGNSMEPVYHDGDIILVKAGYDNSNGDVYVIDYDEKSYVKKLYNDGDRFRLVSINRDYENIIIDIPVSDDKYFNIVGKVIDSFTPVQK